MPLSLLGYFHPWSGWRFGDLLVLAALPHVPVPPAILHQAIVDDLLY